MAARYFNWKLATVLVVAVGVFTVAAYALHQWQKTSRAVQALPLGRCGLCPAGLRRGGIQYGKYVAVNARRCWHPAQVCRGPAQEASLVAEQYHAGDRRVPDGPASGQPQSEGAPRVSWSCICRS